MISSIFYLTRPLSNIKNIAIFLLAFYMSGSEPDIINVFLGIFSVSLICSAAYCYNSYTDYFLDKNNINKKHYSVSIDKIGYKNILYIYYILAITGLVFGCFVNFTFLFFCTLLLLVNFVYSTPAIRFKEKAFLDIIFGAFLTYPLRFLCGWFVFSSVTPPFLILFILGFAKAGGYMMYKELDRQCFVDNNTKNFINKMSKKQVISTALTFFVISIFSFILMCLNSVYLNINFLGKLPLKFLIAVPFAIPPFVVIFKQVSGSTAFNNNKLRVAGLFYMLFVVAVIVTFVL